MPDPSQSFHNQPQPAGDSASVGPPTYPDISPDNPSSRLGQPKGISLTKGLAAGGLIVTGLMAAIFLVRSSHDIRQRAAQEKTAITYPETLPAIPAPDTATLAGLETDNGTTTVRWNHTGTLSQAVSFYRSQLPPAGWQVISSQAGTATPTHVFRATQTGYHLRLSLQQFEDNRLTITVILTEQ